MSSDSLFTCRPTRLCPLVLLDFGSESFYLYHWGHVFAVGAHPLSFADVDRGHAEWVLFQPAVELARHHRCQIVLMPPDATTNHRSEVLVNKWRMGVWGTWEREGDMPEWGVHGLF